MNHTPDCATMDALRRLGFVPSRSPLNREGLSYDFDNCDLEAYPPDFTGRVAFVGSMDRTARTIYAPIEFYLPTQVISVEQCGALLSYYLRHYPVQNPPAWLIEGQSRQDLLPWRIDAARKQAAYDALPKCFVRRAWLRLALKQLVEGISGKPDGVRIGFNYADGVLSIQCDQERLVVSAKGTSWPKAIVVRAAEMRDLPRRLSSEDVPIVVHDAHLQIGARYYATVGDVEPETTALTGGDEP